MAHRSNQTGGQRADFGFFAPGQDTASEPPSGFEFFTDEAPSTATVAPETPELKPIDREPAEGFLEQLGRNLKAVSQAVPAIPSLGDGADPEQTREALQEAGERAVEFVFPITRGSPIVALPAGAEYLLRAGISEVTGKELPYVIEVGDVEISTRPFEDIVAQTEQAQAITREFFNNDESQLLNIGGEIVGAFAGGEALFKAAPLATRFAVNKLTPKAFKVLTNAEAQALALSRLSAAERATYLRLTGGVIDDAATFARQAENVGQSAQSIARALIGGAEGGLYVAGLSEDADAQEVLLGAALGVGAVGGLEIGGRVLLNKAAKSFPTRRDVIRRIAESGEDLKIEGFPAFLGRIDANLQLGGPVQRTSDEAIASIRATLSAEGETGALGAVRGLTDLRRGSVEQLRQAFPNYRFEVVGGVSDDPLAGLSGEARRIAANAEEVEVLGRSGQSLDLAPASRDPKTGRVVTDSRGHMFAREKLPENRARSPEVEDGFIGPDGEFLTRSEAERLVDEGIEFRRSGVTDDPVSDQKLVFGLQPGQQLPEGTRTAPSLTDKVLDDFRQTGLLRDQKVLVDGMEHRFLSQLDNGDLLVKPQQGKPYAVSPDRVARLDESAALLENPRLFRQFREFQGRQRLDDIDRAADEFIDTFLDDLDPSLRPHLKRYFREQEAKFLAQRLRPDESAALQRFRSARKQLMEEGRNANESLDLLAASRGHVVHRMSGGRVKVTNLLTGQTTPPFRNAEEASQYLAEMETRVPDITPSIEGVPDELLQGMAVPAAQPNPGIPSGEDLINAGIMEWFRNAPEAFKNLWVDHLGRWATQMEPAAVRIEKAHGVPIWTNAIRPLADDLTIVRNRSSHFMERLSDIMEGVDDADQDLIEGWLRSEAKSQFEAAHDMPARLVEKAEDMRLWYEDLFQEFSASTGVELSADDWLRNYAPDMMDYTALTGNNDYVQLFRNTQNDVPEEVQFFSEMFKSGEMALTPQAPLFAKAARQLRAGMFKAHAGESFENAVQFSKTLDDGSIPQIHLIDYLTGVRGPTDMVRDRLNRAHADLLDELGISISAEQQRNLIDGMMDSTYGALMGWRPSIVLRNLTQPVNLGAPFLGARRVVKAQADALKPAVQEWALRIGAIRKRPAVAFAESFEEGTGFLNRFGQTGLRAYSAADEWNRAALALATRRKVEPRLQRFLDGELNSTEFLEESGLWFLDGPQRDLFFDILDGAQPQAFVGDTPFERAVNFASNELGSKLTNFMYGARNQPRWTRGSVGRVFGSYGTWSMGYLNYIAQMAAADVRAGVKVKAFAKHAAFNIGVHNAGKAAGIGLGSWVAWNSLTFAGGPLREFLFSDVPNLWGGLPSQREEAWRRVVRTSPRFFLPGGQLLFGDVPAAVQRLREDELGAAIGEAAGFRTLDPSQRQNLPAAPTPFGEVPPAPEQGTPIQIP